MIYQDGLLYSDPTHMVTQEVDELLVVATTSHKRMPLQQEGFD